jgi:hypothetical protein
LIRRRVKPSTRSSSSSKFHAESLGFSIAPAEFLDIVEYLTAINK